MSVSWVLNRQYTSTDSKLIEYSFLDNLISGYTCSVEDEYHIEGEMGMPLPPFVAKFNETLLHGNLLCIADEDGHVKLVDTRKTKGSSLIKEWSAHSNAVFDLAWIANEPKLVTASGDQTARLWDIEKAETIANFRGHTCSLKSVAVQPDSNRVFITGARDGNIMAWDTRCNRKNGFYNPMNTIAHAHVMPVKETLTLSGRKRRSRRSSMYSADAKASVTSAIFQGTRTVISSGACDGILKFWDLRKNYTSHKGDPVAFHIIPFPGKSPRVHGYSSLVVDSTMSRLFAACTNDTIYEYSTSNLSSKPLAKYQGHMISSFYVKTALSPDDRFLLCGSSDGHAYVWRTDRPSSPPWMLKGHLGEVTSVTWSPSIAEKIVTCSDDNTFKVWRLFQNLDDKKQVAGQCERQNTLQEKEDLETLDTQQQQQHCEGIPGTRRRRKHLPPLNLCTDRKVTVTWKFHNMKKTPLHKQPSPAVCTTPDPVELTESPKPCTSVTTPNRLIDTPKSIKAETPVTPAASSTTPTSVTSSNSRISEGRTPKSSRLFMETWLRSPGSPASATRARRTCTRKQNGSDKDSNELELKTKLTVIQETWEQDQGNPVDNRKPSENESKSRLNSCNSIEMDSPVENKTTPVDEEKKASKTKKRNLKETPQRGTKGIRGKKKLIKPKSECIKTFLLPVKRKRSENEEQEDTNSDTRQVAKCLRMENADDGKENSSSKNLDTVKMLENEVISADQNESKVVLSENCRTPTRVKDLLDLADDSA